MWLLDTTCRWHCTDTGNPASIDGVRQATVSPRSLSRACGSDHTHQYIAMWVNLHSKRCTASVLDHNASEGWSSRISSCKPKSIKAGWGCVRRCSNPLKFWQILLFGATHLFYTQPSCFSLQNILAHHGWFLTFSPPILSTSWNDTTSEYRAPVRCGAQCTAHCKTSVFVKLYWARLAFCNLPETVSYKAKGSQ